MAKKWSHAVSRNCSKKVRNVFENIIEALSLQKICQLLCWNLLTLLDKNVWKYVLKYDLSNNVTEIKWIV